MAEETGSVRWKVNSADLLSVLRHGAVAAAAAFGVDAYKDSAVAQLSPEEQAALIGVLAAVGRFVWRLIRKYN